MSVIAGKSSEVIGNKDSTLILRGSSVKVQWGNKFIDLIKNGKIVSDNKIELFYTVDTVEAIKKDGIYLVGEEVWLSINGNNINLSNKSDNLCVSFLKEQETTPEQKYQALSNIGFYYNSLADAQEVTAGIIYVANEGKLYIAKGGNFSEYKIANDENKILDELVIGDLKIHKQTGTMTITSPSLNIMDYLIFENQSILAKENLEIGGYLQSHQATNNYGYRLYILNGKSYLEIDNIICRNPIGGSENSDRAYYPIKYFNNENLIIDQELSNNKTIITLLFTNITYQVGDILYTSFTKDNLVIGVNIVIDEVLGENKYSVTSLKEDDNSVIPSEEGNLVNRKVFSKKIKQNGEYQPISKIEGYNYDLLNKHQEINTRIGYIADIPTDGINFVYDYTGTDIGLYSNNALLQYSNILNSAIYDSKLRNAEFVNITKYSTNVTLAEDLNDETIVTAEWVKKQIDDLEIPEGGEDYSDDIATLDSKITNLSNAINTTIAELNTTITNLTTTITNLESEIKNGSINNPIVLISGTLTKNSNGIFIFSGNKKEYITSITASTLNGLMTIQCVTEGKTVKFTSSNITQYNSGNTSDLNESKIEDNGVGAHWFESRFGINNTIYVREFHQGNENNDSWNSDIWVHSDAVNSINITVFGYAV